MSKRTRLLSKLKYVYSHNTKLVLDVSNDDIGLIIEGVEKQIAKKVKIEQWMDTKCKCGYSFSKDYGDGYYSVLYKNRTNYCSNCGQKLDWSEVN